MEDLVNEFLVESTENLDQLDRDLVALEKDPADKSTLSSIFRNVHTIKGTCGFLGFSRLEHISHVGETLLGRLREGSLRLTAERTSALLGLSDAVRAMLVCIAETGAESDIDHGALIDTLQRLQSDVLAEDSPLPAAAKPHPTTTPAVVPATLPTPAGASAHSAAAITDAAPSTGSVTQSAVAVDATVRVDVGLLDELMNQVGELVLARNQILCYASAHESPQLTATTQRLNLITTELQEGVMKARMQPIGNVWSKLPRVVRDLAAQCGKQVRLQMEGADTELDRTILEAIKDPLTHIVRNSMDHGIELPAVRTAARKSAEGCIRLRAAHESGQVVIEISDDGGGIDGDRVKDKALRSDLISAEQAARMSDRDAVQLIFLAGLSTAQKVSSLSGRGVGMDVVKTNVERIGGTVDVHTTLGRGTTLRIRIPLTLAIVPALIVACADDQFAIPQVSLLELVRLETDQLHKSIEWVHNAPVYRLRGRLLPVAWLAEVLGIGTRQTTRPAMHMAVLQAERQQFGLILDEVTDNQEIVVKPLGKQLKSLTCYAGATILGDGRVALILDAPGVAKRAGLDGSTARDEREPATEEPTTIRNEEALLLFAAASGERMAVRLTEVTRLEEFAVDGLERIGQRYVVQYNGGIMPLLHVQEALGRADDGAWHKRRHCQVIVCTCPDGAVGVVVDEILDIVEHSLHPDRAHLAPGVLGTAVVQGKVTQILDIDHILLRAGLAPEGTQ